MRNVSEDFGLENKTNLIVTTIRIGDWETLETLLEIVDQR